MGLVYVKGTVSNNGKSVRLNFLVDSGAKYTLLPLKAWKALKLKSMRSMEFILADGTPVVRHLSECLIRLPQGSGHTPVILGEKNDAALLGVITLEEFGLTFNPFERTLQPARMMLAAVKEQWRVVRVQWLDQQNAEKRLGRSVCKGGASAPPQRASQHFQ